MSVDTQDIASRLRSALHEIAADVRVDRYGERTAEPPRPVVRARPKRLLIGAVTAVTLLVVAATSILLLPSGNPAHVQTAAPRSANTPREMPASAKPHLDWCAVADSLDQQADNNNQQLADLNRAIADFNEQLAQVQAGGEGLPAPMRQAQINSLENNKRVVDGQKRLVDQEVPAAHAKCDEQQANPPRCFRKQRLTEAQWRDLQTQLRDFETPIALDLGLAPTAPQAEITVYRCQAGQARVRR